MLRRNVAEGIHLVEDAYTNWFLVDDGRSLTVVDTGFRRSWSSLHPARPELGRSPGDAVREAGTLLAGDAVVMLDPYAGRRHRFWAATADSA